MSSSGIRGGGRRRARRTRNDRAHGNGRDTRKNPRNGNGNGARKRSGRARNGNGHDARNGNGQSARDGNGVNVRDDNGVNVRDGNGTQVREVHDTPGTSKSRAGNGNGTQVLDGNGNGSAVRTLECVSPIVPSSRAGSTDGQVMTQRWEVKYVIDRSLRTALDRDLCALMDPDKYTARDGSYIVRSLYFDTPDYMAYHSKISGEAVRHKLRTRIYTDRPETAKMVRMEIKSRYIGTVHKTVADVTIDDYKEIWDAAQRRILPSQRILDLGVGVRQFFRLLKLYNMEPKILVQYRRRAFERRDVSRVRVNFDDELVGSRNLDLLAHIPNARRLLRYDHTVFEVKVDGVMPFWLHMLIDKYHLQNRAFSKFCNAIYSEARTSAILRDG